MIEDSSKKLVQQSQTAARSVMALNRETERLRKADTRRKIQLGGLIVKAGLSEESSSVILGFLHEAKINLDAQRKHWQLLGDAIFQNEDYSPSMSE